MAILPSLIKYTSGLIFTLVSLRCGGPLPVLLLTVMISSCAELEQMAQDVDLAQIASALEPTQGEMSSGLKGALEQGTRFAVQSLGEQGGYFNDPVSKIVFPPEAQYVADTLQKFGLGGLVTEFEKRLNQGASQGAQKALPIFSQAVRQMSFADVKGILLGGETAATDYFRRTSTKQLVATFSPEIRNSLSVVNASQYWQDITQRYNALPLVSRKVNTDLVAYTTEQAIEGLFLKIAEEERKIRANPQARASQIMQRVFGYADQHKGNTGYY